MNIRILTFALGVFLASNLTLSAQTPDQTVNQLRGIPANSEAATPKKTDRPKAPAKEEEKADPKADEKGPLIQVAILLDNSGSMKGLINQARTMIWDMVNDLSNAKRDGLRPRLEVALYNYGSRPTQMKAFTEELDDVSEALFSLGISGGDEYCGAVIRKSIAELQWSEDPHDLKLIIIAGNEPFTQGPVLYSDACTEAINKAVVVNSIHCGDWQVGADTKWQHGAEMTQGSYANINQGQQVAHIPAPQDKKLAELNDKLNKTFIAFGAKGAALQQRQIVQDANALKANPSVLASRCMTKAGGFYCNSSWDLVDAVKEKKVKLADLKVEELPESMKKMTTEERTAHVKKMETDRKAIQAEIKTVSTERTAWVAAERKRLAEEKGEEAEETLDHAFRKAARAVGESRGFTF